MKGNIVILPLLNQEGFYTGSKQINPLDNKNLNREFLSDSNTITDKIVKFIKSEIYTISDFIVDLHGGDINESMTPLVFCPSKASDEINRISQEGAKHLLVDYRIPSTSQNGLYGCATANGVPALLLEIGGEGRYTQDEVDMCINSVVNIAGYLGICGYSKENTNQQEAKQSVYDEATLNGYWYPMIQKNQEIKENQVLGVLKDIDDNIIHEYKAQFDGRVMYYTTSLGVSKGDNLICYSKFK